MGKKLDILFEDNHLIAVNKNPGDLVQGDQTGDAPLPELIKAYIKKKYDKPGEVFLGVIHRLDRPTSGVVLFARTSKGLERMNAAFKNRQTSKKYWALVEGQLSGDGELQHYLKKNPKNNKALVLNTPEEGAKEAKLSYQTLKVGDRYSLVEVDLQTGRHHQIRAQFASIGHPIKGDIKYGARRAERDRSICLHAHSLEFTHPTTKVTVNIIAPPPDSFLPFL
jgi:23S rRNA pseudouridine1911/1915/1917 synthase